MALRIRVMKTNEDGKERLYGSYFRNFEKQPNIAHITKFIDKFLADKEYRKQYFVDGEHWDGCIAPKKSEKSPVNPRCASAINRLISKSMNKLKFKDFAALKTYGMDGYSRLSIHQPSLPPNNFHCFIFLFRIPFCTTLIEKRKTYRKENNIMSEKENNKSLVPANNNMVASQQGQHENNNGPKYGGVSEAEPSKGNEEVAETRYSSDHKNTGGLLGIILGILALLLVLALLVGGYRYVTTGTGTHSSQPAEQVMAEKNSPDLKAQKLDPSRVYNLKEAKDSYNGLTLTITKAQFRQDATRLWVKVDNDSGQKIHMMPNVNSSLVDNNGHTYKADGFAGDSITYAAPNAHEEIMLVFEPVRADASSVTFNLDSVFDMKKAAWNYAINFDLP